MKFPDRPVLKFTQRRYCSRNNQTNEMTVFYISEELEEAAADCSHESDSWYVVGRGDPPRGCDPGGCGGASRCRDMLQ